MKKIVFLSLVVLFSSTLKAAHTWQEIVNYSVEKALYKDMLERDKGVTIEECKGLDYRVESVSVLDSFHNVYIASKIMLGKYEGLSAKDISFEIKNLTPIRGLEKETFLYRCIILFNVKGFEISGCDVYWNHDPSPLDLPNSYCSTPIYAKKARFTEVYLEGKLQLPPAS